MLTNADRVESLDRLTTLLVGYATGGSSTPAEAAEYKELRSIVLADPVIKDRMPRFLRSSRTIYEFWNFIKHKFGTYAERREYLWGEFNPVINELELGGAFPSDATVAGVIDRPDRAFVHEHWNRALERRETDPAGAITAARSLLESVCKAILHEAGEEFADDLELPKIYSKVAALLNLAPNQHSEQVFKQVLGGCHSVVAGLGAIRSREGDAHGNRPMRYRPKPRHAQLAVNLAGATATFLIESWEEHQAAKAAGSDDSSKAAVSSAN